MDRATIAARPDLRIERNPSRVIGRDRFGFQVYAPCGGHDVVLDRASGAFIGCLTCDESEPFQGALEA